VSFDCEFWCNFDTHCLSGHITVGISLGRCVVNMVISTTLHIYSSVASTRDYFLGCLFGINVVIYTTNGTRGSSYE
jgi:hypothetical protein